jgi:hypothetical protein
VVVKVADRDDPLVAFLGESIAITDEIYQIRDFDVGGSRILLSLDPTSVDLARPDVHRHPYGWPLAWTRSYGGGREILYGARPRRGGAIPGSSSYSAMRQCGYYGDHPEPSLQSANGPRRELQVLQYGGTKL